MRLSWVLGKITTNYSFAMPDDRSTKKPMATGATSASEKMEQQAQRLYLYGLVQSLSYVVRFNDLKAAQHFRARLAWVVRRPYGLSKPLHRDLKGLFEVSGALGPQRWRASGSQTPDPKIDPPYRSAN
jgi:hypothetical protein